VKLKSQSLIRKFDLFCSLILNLNFASSFDLLTIKYDESTIVSAVSCEETKNCPIEAHGAAKHLLVSRLL
jgi:hypothetical protein